MANQKVYMHRYHIPKTYFEPAMLALWLYKEKDYGYNRAVDIAYKSYTNPDSKNYIPPSKLNRNTLSKHLIKYITNS